MTEVICLVAVIILTALVDRDIIVHSNDRRLVISSYTFLLNLGILSTVLIIEYKNMLIFIILELIHLEMVVSLHFKVDLLKSKSLEDFIENRGVAYKVWIIEVIYIIAGVIAFRINKFISIAIIAVSLVTFIRDIMNEKDIKTIKECNYATDTKIITVSSSNGLSKLVNNKYTLYYMLDEKKRGIDNYKALKIGKSYRVTLLKFAAGDYIIDYKETR